MTRRRTSTCTTRTPGTRSSVRHPISPYADYGANGDFMGGSQQANALAMERSWARMIEFINDPWHP